MKVVINSQEELIKYARDLTHLVANLRHSQKEWQEYYGADLLNKKKVWEKRMDEFINQHNIETTKIEFQVEIEIDEISEDKKQSKIVNWVQDKDTYTANLEEYQLCVIRQDEFNNCFWDVRFNGKIIASCDGVKLKPSVKAGKEAAVYQWTKHKKAGLRKKVNS